MPINRRLGFAALGFMLLALCVTAMADETEVLFEGNNAAAWDRARDQARLDKEFNLDEVTPATDPASILWHFTPKDAGFNDIFLHKQFSLRFSAIRVRVKNEGAALTLAAKVADADGAEWTAQTLHLDAGADWQWVEFPAEKWVVASWSKDPDGKMDLPIQYFTLITFDIANGTEYKLRVSRVEVVSPDRPVATVQSFKLPATLRHGQTVQASLSFSLDRPCIDDGAFLQFRRDGVDQFKTPIPLPTPLSKAAPRQKIAIDSFPVTVPDFAWGGKYTVALHLGEAHVRQAGHPDDQEVCQVTIEARGGGKTVAEVKRHNGVPTLFINGKPYNGMTYAAYGPSVEVFSDFAKAGVNLYTFAATPTESGYGLAKTAWTAPGQYDFSQLDERVMMVLQANPNAYFFPRLYIHAPRWWSEKHPDQRVLFDPGDGKYLPFLHAEGKPAPSWCSDQWRRDTVEGLRQLIGHVEASPYADRCIGYHIASGSTEEWMMWGANEDQWVDYSPANLACFRAWLQKKYGSVDKLQAAWNNRAVTFATAQIPPKAKRQHSEMNTLRDPATEQAVIDYYRYNSENVADTITYFCHAVKQITHGEKIAGAFYGYILQLCGEQRQQNAGHLGLEKVLASPDVDFVCSPTSYAYRGLGGEGTSDIMSLLGSVERHGKLWFDENDIRTSLSGGAVGEWGRPADVDGDIIQQNKELGRCFVDGTAQWWFDVGANKYNDPKLMGRIGELVKVSSQVQDLDRTPADEVAMVVDESSLCYLGVGDPMGAWLLVSQLPALARIGAPVGHYLVTDLPLIADRKVFLIMTSFAPTEADRKAIDALKRDGHILVFMYAPGLYRDGKLDEQGMSDLTGIRLRASMGPAAFQVKLRGGNPITEGLDGVTYGVDHRAFPVVYADDPAAVVLGTLADGHPGLVVKKYPNWTAIHSSAPMLPTPLLRNIAKAAGVHLYIDTPDVVWASKQLLGVCVHNGGPRTIHLPRAAKVRDLYDGTTLGDGGDSFEADFAPDATRLFAIE